MVGMATILGNTAALLKSILKLSSNNKLTTT